MYPCTEEIIQLVEGHLLKRGSWLVGEKGKCKRRGEAGGSSGVRETQLCPGCGLDVQEPFYA